MTELLLIVGVVLASISSLPYIRELLRGTVRTKLVSWAIWCVLSGVMTVSAFAAGQTSSAMLSMVAFTGCAIIVMLGWRRGDKSMSRLDMACLVGAGLGLLSLLVLKDPLVAIVVSVSVDAIAFIPTLVHGWIDPEEESLACFTLAAVGALATLFAALQHGAALTGLMYPVYAVLFNGAMAAVLLAARVNTYGARKETEYTSLD